MGEGIGMKDIEEIVKPDKKYFIYGVSMLGRYCCDKLGEAFGEEKVIGFIETNPGERKTHNGKKSATGVFRTTITFKVYNIRSSGRIVRAEVQR